jgi:mono/diheme cytochrome c family protein
MLERMLIPTIENRILVGIVSFVGIMVLLGWAAINEGGRMAALEETYHARAIEQGAILFASNCSSCHGNDGRGLAGRAPGLNNPQFFGHDFFPEVSAEVGGLEAEKTGLTSEKSLLNTELTAEGTTEARIAEINARIPEIDARIAEIDTQIAELNVTRTTGVQAAVDRGYDPARPSRVENLGWSGTHESFVLTTLIHGRPVSVNYWPQPMAAWAQTAGGPLRNDQLEDLVAYIENWDKGDAWSLDDLFAVNQYAIEPADPAPLLEQIQLLQQSGGILPEPVGVDVAAITAQLAEVTGDPARGDALYHGTTTATLGGVLGCQGCQLQEGAGTGPQTVGTWTRVTDERLTLPQYAGFTPEQYLVESIVAPGAYIVPTGCAGGGCSNVMVANFGERLTIQDLADIIAYLETMNQ